MIKIREIAERGILGDNPIKPHNPFEEKEKAAQIKSQANKAATCVKNRKKRKAKKHIYRKK